MKKYNFNTPPDYPFPINNNLQEKLENRLIRYRDNSYHMFLGRYIENLLSLFVYYSDVDLKLKYDFDYNDLEFLLRYYSSAVVGVSSDKIVVLGSVNDINVNYVYNKPRVYANKLRLNIDYLDTGYKNYQFDYYVSCYNRKLDYISDINIIKHYAELYAETDLSIFSATMQSKITTFLQLSDIDNEDGNELIEKLYNGSGYIKTSELFNVERQIKQYNPINSDLISNLHRNMELIVNALNTYIGIESLGINKESGVSDIEAQSNSSIKQAHQNSYLFSRLQFLELIKKLTGLVIKCEVSTESLLTLSSMERKEIEDGKNDNS